MADSERGESLRYVTTIAVVVAVLALLGCGALTLLPRQNDPIPVRLMTVKDLAAAYARVRPGLTRASQLSRMGFDFGSANTQTLSYLGVMERFMPRDSVKFDRLNAAVQDCIVARDHCTALVFRPMDRSRAQSHTSFLSAIGLGAAAAASDRPPEITLLVRDGRVAFKMISGLPSIHAQAHLPTAHDVGVLPVAYRTVD
jgi:hypothetical protein